MMPVGMIGLSEGNGHPFSFSAIINGYSGNGLKEAGWPGIHDYVKRRHPADFGVMDLRVTHAWTQHAVSTHDLCHAANIEHGVLQPEDMLGEVEALIIARDDVDSHLVYAKPFLDYGTPVFIDKPLTLSHEELTYFKPYLESGLLMSCSAMRYAMELDELRCRLEDHGELTLVRGTILNDWSKYGIHLLEAILSVLPSRPFSVEALSVKHDALLIKMADGLPIIINTLGNSPAVFDIDVMGKKKISHYSIRDNFSMFRRAIWEFACMVKHGKPAIESWQTLDVIHTLIAGHEAMKTGKIVPVNAQ